MNDSKREHKRISTAISITAFCFIFLVIVIAVRIPPASGYELSIYNVYPWYFWLLIISSLACGLFILVYSAFFMREISRSWLVGLYIICLINLIFLNLSIFRGYVFPTRWDSLTHIGFIKDIRSTHHINKDDFYPIVHILGISLIDICEFPWNHIINVIYTTFFIVYIVNMYLLGKVLINHHYSLLVISFASIPIYSFHHLEIQPGLLSLYMLPLLLYFYYRQEQLINSKIQCKAILFMLAFLITFFHPITTIFTIIIFFTFYFAEIIWRTTKRQNYHSNKNIKNILLTIFITFFVWYFSYTVIQNSFKAVYDWLFYGTGKSPAEVQLEVLNKAELSLLQILDIFINAYGAMSLYLLLSIIFTVLVFTKILFKRKVRKLNFIYSIQFLIALFIGFAMLLGRSGMSSPIRVLWVSILMSIILNTLVLYDVISSRVEFYSRRKILIIIVLLMVILLSVTTLSIFNVYGSPKVIRPNGQVTLMEIAGMKWFEKNRDQRVVIITTGDQLIWRCRDTFLGYEKSHEIPFRFREICIPSHFGYPGNRSIVEALGSGNYYMITPKIGEVYHLIFPENVRQKAHQYTTEDFARLRLDSTVAQIYATDGLKIWRIWG